MNLLRSSLATVAACGLFLSATASAFAAPKDYQITGTISAMTDTTLTIMTLQKESWDIGRSADTKLPDGAKVGDKVTVHYTMLAGTVDAKAAPAAKDKKVPAKGKAAAAKTATEPAASGSPSKPAAEAASPTP